MVGATAELETRRARPAPSRRVDKGGTRRAGDNGVSARTLLLLRPRPAAALEWQDVRVPLLGRLRAAAWLPTILLAASAVALVYLLQTAGVATMGYDIQRLQAERDEWQLRNQQLQLELAKRQSLTWVEAEATGRLGMVRPEATALTYVVEGARVARPAATPTSGGHTGQAGQAVQTGQAVQRSQAVQRDQAAQGGQAGQAAQGTHATR